MRGAGKGMERSAGPQALGAEARSTGGAGGQRKRGGGLRTGLRGLDSSGAVPLRLGSQAEVAGDVPAYLLAPVVGDLGQPSASLLQAGAAFDVGIPGAQPWALGLLLQGGSHGLGSRGGRRISMQAMPTRKDSGRADRSAGFWWSWVSGRQAQADSRAARASDATVVRRLGPVGRSVVIKVARLRHDGGPGGGEPAVQGLPFSRCCLQRYFVTGFSDLPISPQAIFAAMRYRSKRVGKVRNRPMADIGSSPAGVRSRVGSGHPPWP